MSSESATNPLLQVEFSIPFHRIRAEHVKPAIDELLREAKDAIEATAAHPGPRTYENTLGPLDKLTEKVDYAMAVVRHLESVATYPELRAAYNEVQAPVSAFYASIPLHEGLWRAVQAFAATDEAKALTDTRKRYLSKTITGFRRHGADLDPAGKARLAEIDVELGTLTTKFSENVLDSTNAFELMIEDPGLLAGLPPSAVEGARESAASKGKSGWRFTLQAPSYLAVLTYLDDSSIRQKVYRAFNARATESDKDNRPVIRRILELRQEKAKLLGFQNFADLVLDDRMAHSGVKAREFLADLREKTEAKFLREKEELLAFRRSLEGGGAPELQAWDVGYYAEKQRNSEYGFDEEELRPYFPVDRVISGMFEIAEKLFDIRVEEKAAVPAWDPAVRYFDVRDLGGTFLGSFYADFFPRENKRGGAWMDSFLTGLPSEKGFEPHLGLICGNLTPPVSDKPALLTHREVETVFHEFGHLLHHIFSRVEVRALAGTSVAWDFVELPSQIMENWCWEREALDLFARHYRTGGAIPDDLYQKVKRARNFRAAGAQMRQLSFGTLDLSLHIDYSPEKDGDVIEYARRILKEFSPAPLPDDHAMLAAFTHLFSGSVGYAAGYYSYKWAEVLDADAFTRFREAGIFSREVGTEFREKILSRGDSEDPAELYRQFMGRDPDLNALLRRSGLLSAA